MTPERLDQLLAKLPSLRIGVLGDLFLDRYLELQADFRELSIETGKEAYQVERVRNAPGAMGTVLNNLAAMGVGRLTPITVIGDDGHGFDLMRALPPAAESCGVIQCPRRLTPTYTKPLRPERQSDGSDVWTELNRLDVRTRSPLAPDTQQTVERMLRDMWPQCDGWIVLDQIADPPAQTSPGGEASEPPETGVVNRGVRHVLEELAAGDEQRLLLADSRSRLAEFACGQLKGNRAEVLAAAGRCGAGPADLAELIRDFQRERGQTVFCTDGPRGIWIGSPQGVEIAAAPAASGPIDIVGAGDAATCGLVCGQLAGGSLREAADLANLAAGVTIRQLGATGVARAEWLRQAAHDGF